MGHAVGGKEQSTDTQVKALKTPQVMDKKDSELYEAIIQLKEEIGERRKVMNTYRSTLGFGIRMLFARTALDGHIHTSYAKIPIFSSSILINTVGCVLSE